MADLPLSLYVHFPWCVHKCPYCDFNSHALREELPEEHYVGALLRDLEFELTERAPRPLVSVFLGGGTPSLFSDAAVGRLLEAVARRLPLAADAEITLEANPGTVDAAHFRGYRRAGVNRLSIGVQSLDPAQLQKLGRIHDPAAAVAACRMARDAGFDNVNLDLMYALPGQDVPAALRDLEALVALQPEHVSYYQLTLEPNTEFARQPPRLPDDDVAWDMQVQGQHLLAARGYEQYEVSAYARPGRRSRHNLNYWEFGDYLGIGAGAHGKWTTSEGTVRRARQRHPKAYLGAAGTAAVIQEERRVDSAELPFEYCMNALRLNQGFDLRDFEARTGASAQVLSPALQQAIGRGLLELRDGLVRTSPQGRAHLNAALRLFLPEPPVAAKPSKR